MTRPALVEIPYLVGFGAASSASRTGEAVVDLLTPAADLRNDRVRHDAIRGELRRLTEFQETYHAESGEYADDETALAGGEGFVLRSLMRPKRRPTLEGRRTQNGWVATLSHEESPVGEACAVALGVEPAYAGGIPLKRVGRIRCTWDLATRLNRLW